MSDQNEAPLGSYQFSEYSQPASMPYAPYPPHSYGYPATSYPTLPAQAIPRQKKKLYFPLTRNVSPGQLATSMVIYSILMIVLSTGSVFFFALRPTDRAPGVIFANPDGTVDGLQILVFILFVFLILPATNVLSGTLFGTLWGFLVTCLIVGVTAGLWISYASLQHIPLYIDSAHSPAVIVPVLSPITAVLVGLFYDRRSYAAWWKSFLTMLLGSAFFVIVLLTLVVLLGHPTDASALATFYIGIGCIGFPLILLMALSVAGLEGLMHALLAAQSNKNR